MSRCISINISGLSKLFAGAFTICEFKVFVTKGDREDSVAEDILYAKVENASIVKVDVEAELLILTKTGVPHAGVGKRIR